MVGCFPCGGSHTQVNLDHCYPPSKQLAAAGPDYKPLNEDLSKLIASLSGKPSQLTKTGEELEARVNKEARGSSGGYAKFRASLLISLSILKSLIKECAPDLPLFSRSALRIIVTALDVKVYQKGGADVEVVSRAASCFTAFATYTDGSPIGSDATITKDYLSALSKFGRMAVESDQGAVAVTEKPVLGEGRTKIIGLASLISAAGSDALVSSEKVFSQQVDIIIPVLLSNLFESSLDDLKLEAERLQNDTTSSPFFSEFSARRAVNDRRAPSLRGKATGEKGSSADIPSATLRCLKALMAQCQWNQASTVLEAVFAYLDKRRWSDVERCCFLIELLAKFTSDQYRYIVPTRLVEVLADIPDSAPTPKQSTVLAMLTTILNSPSPLVGLGVSDIVDNLLSIIIRRIHINDRDSLLPPLVQCVASLGAHIHYADQVNVIIEEISLRLAEISPVDKNRSEILRVLVHCMTGVLRVVHAADDRETARNPPVIPVSADKGKGPQIDTPIEPIPQRPTSSRRNPVALQVWQETLTLLCESSYAVRSVYARALLLFLEREMPREGSGVKAGDDAVASFCNALHAALYTLAMSACLGTGSPADESPTESISGSPVRTTNPRLPETDGENPTKGVSFNLVEPTPSDTPQSTHTPPNGQRTPPRKRRQSRRVSLPLNRLNSSNFIPLASFDNVATPLDFAYIVKILDTLRSIIPVTALMTGGPMLFALDAAAGTELVRRSGDGRSGAWVLERKRGIRETVGLVWRGVGKKWNVGMVDDLATKCVAGLPEPFVIPNLYTPDESDILPPPDEPLSFTQNMIEGESSSASKPLLDSEIIISALASSNEVQRATNLGAGDIVRRLGAAWSVETALRDSIGHANNVDLPSDAHFNNINPLMTNTNPSYRSFSKTQASPTRAVGVADLREALNQGQGPAVGPSRGSSIVSTVGTGGRSFSGDGASGLGMNGHGYANGMLGNGRKEDVREVLKDIFREKKRNGAGKDAQGQLSTAVKA